MHTLARCYILSLAIAIAFGGVSQLTLLQDEVKTTGARCLDGTPAGYYYRQGSENSWVVHLEGGGWCYYEHDCYERSKTVLGSSKTWSKLYNFNNGVLSDDKQVNPDFYDWHSVFVPYCDGISFAGNRDLPVSYNERYLYFRGHRILTAVIKSLLNTKGMSGADRVILSGCSAGGLAVYYGLDYVRSLLPQSIALSGLADAGYFIQAPDKDGNWPSPQPIYDASYLHNTSSGVNQNCAKAFAGNESACLSAPISYKYITTPLFSLNSQYDTWQLNNIVKVDCLPPNCNKAETKAIQDFREEFIAAAQPMIDSNHNGAFLDSCLVHCQSRDNHYWSEVMVQNMTAHEVFGNWYFKRNSSTKEVDCAYPCNSSC